MSVNKEIHNARNNEFIILKCIIKNKIISIRVKGLFKLIEAQKINKHI